MNVENMVRHHYVNNGVVGGPEHNVAETILGIVEDTIAGPTYKVLKEGETWVSKPTKSPYVVTPPVVRFHCKAVLEVHRTNGALETERQEHHGATVSVDELQLLSF